MKKAPPLRITPLNRSANHTLRFAVAVVSFVVVNTNGAESLRSVSAADGTNIAAAGSSFAPAFSADGRFVVFVSHAKNLVTNDDLVPFLNVFVRDLVTSNTVLVSANLTGLGGGNADAISPSISSNGQFITFLSAASNLVNNDTNNAPDIFVRDLVSGVTTLASVGLGGVSSTGPLAPWAKYRLSSNPLLSADGRCVVFESLATNLVALGDTNEMTDIFVRDLRSNTTSLVSVNAAGTGSGNGNSEWPSMTPDGRFVAFVSTSTDLAAGVTNQSADIYVRDLQAGTTVWASSAVVGFFYPPRFGGNYPKSYHCFSPVLSANGQVVVFKAISTNLTNAVLLVRRDLQTEASTVLSTNASATSFAQVSADGRFIVSEISTNLYIWDSQTGSNVLVSGNLAGTRGGNDASHTPVMTPDGRTVVFLSAATNLVTSANNGVSQVYVRDLVMGTTRLVSANRAGVASDSPIDATLPAVSSDGRLVAFESTAADLVANDLNQASDIFVRDLGSQTTQLISARHPGLAAGTAPRPSAARVRSISADGRYVAMSSLDFNFVVSDTNGFPDIFVRDISTGAIMPVSVDDNNAFATNRAAVESVISANGRFVVFGIQIPCQFDICGYEDIFRRDLQNGTTVRVSVSTNGTPPSSGFFGGMGRLSPAVSSNGNLVAFHTSDVFVRNIASDLTKLVSINLLGDGGGSDVSFNPLFSPDDRWIVFASGATNLTTNSTGRLTNLFARDLLLKTTRMISVGPESGEPLGYSRGLTFSANSRYAAFVISNNSIAIYDFVGQTNLVVCSGCDHPTISADGRLVVYETILDTAPKNILLKDLQTGATSLMSRSRLGPGGGNGDSTSPLISSDGRYVVFASKASDLVENDTNQVSDIFVRDRLLGTTLLASQNLQGNAAGNGVSSNPILGADGRTVVFQSFASDLVAGDFNDDRDVFVLRLGGVDSDGDGMDDDWEMAYFGTLARDGAGDFDSDGLTDRQEFLAGTDPTNSGSILRVMTVNRLGGGTTVVWSAVPGRTYQVQFKDDINDLNWSDVGGPSTASSTTGSLTDPTPSSSSHRFYRVILAQ